MAIAIIVVAGTTGTAGSASTLDPATTTVADAARGSGIGPLSRAAPTGGGVTAGAEAGKTAEHTVPAAGLH